MGEKIALGFHTCVDYELKWDTGIVESLIEKFDIHDDELKTDIDVDSERAAWIVCLAHLKAGIGGEMVPATNQICEDFAEHFKYDITIGGTATRAAIAIQKLGYSSAIQMCCFNEHIKRLLPEDIHYFSSVGEDHTEIYPHVILQYQGNVRIHANDIDFVTPRENRVMLSRDADSLDMQISEEFAPMIRDSEVFLLSCFSEILDFDILADRMKKTRALLRHLPDDALVVLEDGCYVKKDFRYYVHKELSSVIDILSMNEDELQEFIGRRIDILDAKAVLEAVEEVYERAGIKTILVHSAAWALAYGEKAAVLENALEGGVTMAATRFQWGDDFGVKEYNDTKALKGRPVNEAFCAEISKLAGDKICCIPCKDLSFVKHPTVVGLGDFFVGGLLPGLLAENRN